MGEFVTDLDDSYTTEEYVDVPPPPKKVPSSCPGRFIVALPQRAQMDAVSEEQGSDVQPEIAPTTTAFGFPVPAPAPCDKSRPVATSQERRARNRSARSMKGSDKPQTRSEHPNRRTRPATTTVFPEVFHSITATPGLDERSFEVRVFVWLRFMLMPIYPVLAGASARMLLDVGCCHWRYPSSCSVVSHSGYARRTF